MLLCWQQAFLRHLGWHSADRLMVGKTDLRRHLNGSMEICSASLVVSRLAWQERSIETDPRNSNAQESASVIGSMATAWCSNSPCPRAEFTIAAVL